MNIFAYFKKKGIETIDSSFYDKIALWDSWYRADVKKFHWYRVYRGASKYERCHRKSLGMGKKLCEDISDLLLNEKVKITLKDDATKKFVDKVLEDANFLVQGNEYQERKAACGTVAYVPYLTNMILAEDGSVVSADVKLDYVVAKNIYPTAWENSRITECVFVFIKTYNRKKYAQFQYHKTEPLVIDGIDSGIQYVIENSVVDCSTSGAGRELTPEQWNEIPYFRGLAARVETGSDKPQFVIDKLNIANNVDEDDTNPMGVSIYANSIDVLAKLDIEYDSYANEFTLGRKRIFVAPELLTAADGSQVFDPDDSVFYQLPEDYFKDSHEAMHEVDMKLRVSEHEQAINNDLNLLSFKCGFGTQYYKFERGAVATATQVISEDSDLYRSVCKHEIILEDVLKDLIRVIIRLGKSANVQGLNENTDITINFDDSIIEDKQTERQEDRQDVAMGAMGLAEYRAKWYGETEEIAQTKLPEQSGGILM
jgi:A118 family predicted phage portal protein